MWSRIISRRCGKVEARFRTIFEGTDLGIALVDKSGRVVESNPGLQRMLRVQPGGYSQPVIHRFFLLPEEVSRCQAIFEKLVEGKQVSYHRREKIFPQRWRAAGAASTCPHFRAPKAGISSPSACWKILPGQKQAEKEIRTYQEQLGPVRLGIVPDGRTGTAPTGH